MIIKVEIVSGKFIERGELMWRAIVSCEGFVQATAEGIDSRQSVEESAIKHFKIINSMTDISFEERIIEDF